MTKMPDQNEFGDTATANVAPQNGSDTAHIWRSKLIDKFAQCERELRLIYGAETSVYVPLKQLAITISKRIASASHPAKQNVKLDGLITQLLPLIELRGEIAHAQLMEPDGLEARDVLLAPVVGHSQYYSKIIYITSEQRREAYSTISRIANQLQQRRLSLA